LETVHERVNALKTVARLLRADTAEMRLRVEKAEREAWDQKARRADTDRYATFFQGMMDRGVFLPPSAFESAFLSDAHGEAEIDRTLEAADEALEGAS